MEPKVAACDLHFPSYGDEVCAYNIKVFTLIVGATNVWFILRIYFQEYQMMMLMWVYFVDCCVVYLQ